MQMLNLSKRLLLAIGLLSLAACAGQPYREQPHHYSKSRDGERVACFQTEVVNEYECVPVERRYVRHGYYHPYDPFWPFFTFGFVYGVHHHGHVAYYPYPYHHHGHHRRWRR
jgi:hypothetical protein